jgi:hypothetical protein
MADRPMLVQISSEKDDSPNRFSKGTIKEEVLDILIPITVDTFLTTFPIFPSQIVFGSNNLPLQKPEKFFYF